MKSHLVHGAIAATVAVLISGGVVHFTSHQVEQVVHSIRASKHAWPDLTDAEKKDLAARLDELKGTKLLILCPDAACTDLAMDIDDAAEMANVESALDRPALPLGYGIGVQAENGDPRAEQLAAALRAAGLPVTVTRGKTLVSGYPLWIIIGKYRPAGK